MLYVTSTHLSYVYLGLAIFLEVLGTLCVKESDGFTKFKPSCLLFLYYALSFIAVTLASKKLDVSLVYPIWTGSAIAIVSIWGIISWNEHSSAGKLVSLCFILIGLVGLTMSSKT